MIRKQISYIINTHEYTTLLGKWSKLSNRIDLAKLDYCACYGNYYIKN